MLSETEELELLRLRKQRSLAQPETKDAGIEELKNPVTGMRSALDATASIASGAIAGPVSGFAGIVGSMLPGPEGQGADFVKKTQEALTYQPRTQGGQLITDTAAAPFNWLAGKGEQAGSALTEAGYPAIGAGANAVIQAAPAILGQAVKGPLGTALADSKVAAAGRASRNSVKDATLEAARREGFIVPPSEYDPSFVGNRLESIGGKAAIKQQAEINNQQATNKVARREAGLQENDPISEANLEKARDQMAAPYREVAAVSTRAADALEKLKQARADAKVYWKHYGVSADPASLKKAQSLDQRAQVLEKVIDKEAGSVGKPDLLDQLRDARVRIAKNHNVDRALNVGDGNVDALVLGRMRDKGIPLTGGLKTIGDFAEAFPRFARQESKVPAPDVSKVEAMLSTGAGVGGAAAFGLPGVAAAAIPLIAPPIARSIALSRQGPKLYEPNAGFRFGADAANASPVVGIPGPNLSPHNEEALRKFQVRRGIL